MSNPWGVTLKKTGLNQQRLSSSQSQIDELNERQNDLQQLSSSNYGKQNLYDDRQSSLAANAMLGQQGRIYGQGGRSKKRKSKRHIKSRKHRKTRKHRRHRKH
jgi:hypothetical protein